MTNPEATVFVVDDDADVRNMLRRMVESAHLPVQTYDSATAFLEAYDPARPGCLVLDIRMPGMSGLELQERLASADVPIPIIVLSGHANVPMAVQAMQSGAIDLIEKPFRPQVLLDRIATALEADARKREERSRRNEFAVRVARLSLPEKDVMDQLVRGRTLQDAAAELGIPEQIAEQDRAQVFEKMGVESVVELTRLALASDKARYSIKPH